MEGIKLQRSHEHLHNKLDTLFCMLHRVQSAPRIVGHKEMNLLLENFQAITKPKEPPRADPQWEQTDKFVQMKAEEINKKLGDSS